MKFYKIFLVILLLALKPISAFAYQPALPPIAPKPVDIPIQNTPQQTNVWCWAAVAQQIIMYKHGIANTLPQCGLVATSNGVNPNYCCFNFNNCAVTGDVSKIQHLLYYFGGSASSYAAPTDPMTLYQTLAQGKPVIMEISQPYQGMTHVIVIRGMGFAQTPMGIIPMLHVNDPMSYYTQPVPFYQLAPLWKSAIVIHN